MNSLTLRTASLGGDHYLSSTLVMDHELVGGSNYLAYTPNKVILSFS